MNTLPLDSDSPHKTVRGIVTQKISLKPLDKPCIYV